MSVGEETQSEQPQRDERQNENERTGSGKQNEQNPEGKGAMSKEQEDIALLVHNPW